jgi:hypothetical protein
MLEREVEGPGVLGLARPVCYKIWREESALLKHPVASSVFFSISALRGSEWVKTGG